MQSLSARIQAANALLAPYAIPHEGVLGRMHAEEPDETRFPFQRDRDRIIHTQAFRRLKGKTQVFVIGSNDHHRTRLTHTMEVAQISRDIARTMGLNEDLAECIALAHDLGHPPFGHAGESAISAWMQAKNMKGFEHNEQSFRVVTLLEDHTSEYPGLNLNKEILEGLLKHTSPHNRPTPELQHGPTLEAQVVNLADEIAYSGHDCEDGIRAGLLNESQITQTQLGMKALMQASKRNTSLRGALIHLLVHDLYKESERRIRDAHLHSFDDVLHATVTVIAFSDPFRAQLDELRTFLWENLYQHPSIEERNVRAHQTVQQLCERLQAEPNEKVYGLQQKTGGTLEEAIKDYVAGMTDEFAKNTLSNFEVRGTNDEVRDTKDE